MENYVRIKECITMNQTAEDAVVLNYDDPLLREFGESRIEEISPESDEKTEKNEDAIQKEAEDMTEGESSVEKEETAPQAESETEDPVSGFGPEFTGFPAENV